MEPVSIVDSRNFTLRGLTIDYLRKPFSEGVVTDVDEESFTVRFRPERKITEEMPFPRLMLWDDTISGIYRDPFYFAERWFWTIIRYGSRAGCRHVWWVRR